MIFEGIIGPARPLTWVLRFWPALIASFLTALAATCLCKRIALKFGIVDKPDDLVKTHNKPIAYLGGIGILVGLAAGVLVSIGILAPDKNFASILKWLLGIMAGGTIACFIGLVDDIFDIKPAHKILGQVVAAAILLLVGIAPNLTYIESFFNVSLPRGVELALEILIVVFFVIGATNSLNLLDGLDGLCGGVTAIITIAMLALAVHLATWNFSEVGDPVRVIICLGLVGGVCGFLPFNRYPAKIFMGDAGSMLLGFIVAALMMLFAEQIPRWWMASVVVFGLPILDTAVALVRRLLNHRPLFVSDRGHIYDQMVDRGIPLKKSVTICYLLAGIFAIIGLVMSQIRTRYAAVVYVVVFLISALVVWKKGYLKMEGLRGVVKKPE
ncbi:MAG: glycosyltransferase family 4 protein [Planctomycetota bacterium]|jgi:UDP-GlcNAc:undecaprenyl-phosphate GlcNAc-1-phosphate transferase